eukprot:3278330-Amphidinium_carterae.1
MIASTDKATAQHHCGHSQQWCVHRRGLCQQYCRHRRGHCQQPPAATAAGACKRAPALPPKMRLN